MTVWILSQDLKPGEDILSRSELILPFDDYPDFTMAKTQGGYSKLLQSMHPEAPPESIKRMLEKSWQLYTAIHREDLIAVPLEAGEAALAEVTGPCGYRVEDGHDIHTVPVKWHGRLRVSGKHKALFEPGASKLFEVTDAQARIAIRDKIPHPYNRFAKWKWLIVLFGALGLFMRFANRAGRWPF